ncbi:MAG: amidohydrolase family protein [Acidimicrobiia bacterium]|nr:amidohydrolase family protein [Acidimicrobiia bacterium]
MDGDVIIRNGTVVDGTGAPARVADVAICDGLITEVIDRADGRIETTADREIDAEGKIVTPGFVDIHTHLDAQLAWDPIGTSSCWHGVTSVVMGNCGVTFAPCRPSDREFLAEMMESVEDIPRDAILDSLPWDWETYGEYYESIGRLPKGLNAGGMVGHSALRTHAMGERSLDEAPAGADDVAAMADLLDEAMTAGALGVSTSRTFMHRIPDGRPVPGTFAAPDELLAFADVLGRHGAGVFEGAMRLGERDDDALTSTRREIALLGDIGRRSGRPVSFGLTQSNRRPDLYERVIEFTKEENEAGATIRPQTTARGVGILFGLESRTPFDKAPAWRELRSQINGRKLQMLRDGNFRQQLISEADVHGTSVDLRNVFLMPVSGSARYDCDPSTSLAAIADARGVSPAAAFIELLLETDGHLVANMPFLNQDLAAVEQMLDDPLVTLGLADAGAHVGQIMDASQPTFLLTYWVRERGRWSLEESIRRLTSDTADLFGLRDRGRLAVGAHADVNVIDFDELTLPQPEFVHDLPGGAGRYIQRSSGYDHTFVNGVSFMEHGEHTGALPGALLRST